MLPKIDVPVFECYLHSLNKKVKFRSFTVKEEKILLVTKEEDDVRQMIGAIKQVMTNCLVTKIDLNKLAFFDFEYLFLNIRSKSVGDVIPIGIIDNEEKQTYTVNVNINDVKLIQSEDHSKVIPLTDKVGLMMKYPTMDGIIDITSRNAEDNNEEAFEIIKNCIESVYEGETVHNIKDQTPEEVDEFFNSMASEHFNKIQKFFDTMPRLRHEVKYKTKDGREKIYMLEDVSDFF